VDKQLKPVQRAMRELMDHHAGDVAGVLVVEFVERPNRGFGDELFVGIRATREFGPVIAAGLGGIDTEYLAGVMRPGLAVAKAVVAETSAQEFLELFRSTSAYEILAGRARGHRRVVSDGELLRCFRAFLAIARRFCVARDDSGPCLAELEVNPFAFRRQAMVPLDGRGRLGEPARAVAPRPREAIDRMLEPRSIAVLGVSADSMNPGRVILNNIKACGFPVRKLWIVKPGAKKIDGVTCVESAVHLPEPVDLLIVAAPAKTLPGVVKQSGLSGKVRSAILISGGVGEIEGTESSLDELRGAILATRKAEGVGPIFLGPNSLGVRSCPGRYDTFFIPPEKIDARFLRSTEPPARLAFVSQSGAFILSRLSNLEVIRPAFAISIGNQADLTLSDLVAAAADRDDIDVIAVYSEGFCDLDGQSFLHAIQRARAVGKVVIFYKAGRTSAGRSAAAGHTAAVAGDYDVCQAAAAQAGAIVVDTFKEFEQLMELAVALHGKRVRGRRIGAVTNAGAEAVAMADSVRGARYLVEMASLGENSVSRLRGVLRKHRLDALVNPRNPLDLTPMAAEDAYEGCGRLLLESDEVDALVTAVVPLTPCLLTTPDEIAKPGSLVEVVPKLFREADKPVIFVVDCGPLYDPLALAVRRAGVPVFRSCDQAIRSLGRYLCHRAKSEPPQAPENVASKRERRPEPVAVLT
jgi:acyl-CoA synthetase (NDP forming)